MAIKDEGSQLNSESRPIATIDDSQLKPGQSIFRGRVINEDGSDAGPISKLEFKTPEEFDAYKRGLGVMNDRLAESEELEEGDMCQLLEDIPIKTPPMRLLNLLTPVFEILAVNVDEAAAKLFINHEIKDRFNINAREISLYVKRFRAVRERVMAGAEAEREEEQALAEQAATPEMTDEERIEAETWLKTGSLIIDIKRDLTQIGIIGEDNNKVVLYLSCVSRKMAKPINIELRAGSGTGKTNMLYKTLGLMPPEDVVSFTRVTTRFLDYYDEYALQYKILSIAERAGSEEADYSIRMIEDDTNPGIELGYLKKNPKTGDIEQVRRVVKGPTAMIKTTTKLEANPENESREFPMYLNESDGQRAAIHEFIKQSKLPHKAMPADELATIIRRHQNAQRLLQPCLVVIPYAELIEFPTSLQRSNRDLKRFLSFLESCALLHQFKRQRVMISSQEYIVATLGDYDITYHLLREILENAFSELNPASEELLAAAKAIQKTLSENDRFTRKELCRALGWEKYKVARAVGPLETAGYLDVKKEGNAFTYRVAVEDEIKNLADLVLTPKALREKVLVNKENIDPQYGDSYLNL